MIKTLILILVLLACSQNSFSAPITSKLSLEKYAQLLEMFNKSESSAKQGYNQFTFPAIMRFSFKGTLNSVYIGKHIGNGNFLKNNFNDQKYSLKYIEQFLQIEANSSKPVIIFFGMSDGCPPCDEQFQYLETHYGESHQLVYVLVDF